jgi:hypothetical protein
MLCDERENGMDFDCGSVRTEEPWKCDARYDDHDDNDNDDDAGAVVNVEADETLVAVVRVGLVGALSGGIGTYLCLVMSL